MPNQRFDRDANWRMGPPLFKCNDSSLLPALNVEPREPNTGWSCQGHHNSSLLPGIAALLGCVASPSPPECHFPLSIHYSFRTIAVDTASPRAGMASLRLNPQDEGVPQPKKKKKASQGPAAVSEWN